MRRLTTKTIAAAAAAALAMLAITAVVSANAGNSAGAQGPDPSGEQVLPSGLPSPEQVRSCVDQGRDGCVPEPADADNRSAEQVRSCLRSHGVDAPDGDALSLKQWLGEKQTAPVDPAYQDAFIACDLLAAKPDASAAH
jgi:hypothetical protein